jgi:hypothetical protein
VVPDNYPDWFAYGLTQALRYNRGNKAALEYALKQKLTPSLDMLIAEIFLADNQRNKAIPRLQDLSRSDSDIGFRAAWLMSLAYLTKGDIKEASRIVNEKKSLSSSVTGKEILARIAINQGNTREADRLYGLLANESLEAKTYLARRAFVMKDWGAARKYTEDLLTYFPDMMELRENLDRIAREEKNVRP